MCRRVGLAAPEVTGFQLLTHNRNRTLNETYNRNHNENNNDNRERYEKPFAIRGQP